MNFLKNMLRRWYQRLPRNEYGTILWKQYFFRKIRNFFLWFLGLTIAITLLYKYVPVPATLLMFTRFFEQMFDSDRPLRWQRNWVTLDEISPQLQLAVVCGEDQDFLEHEGFDFNAIRKAYQHNKKNPKRIRGASTISQQTAKNVFLWSGRSWLRKGLEVYFTFLIEKIWSKERIMEVYLNSIEFGDGIYGAQAAAQYFYKKNASELSRSEAATLAAVLPNPHIFSAANPSPSVTQRRDWIVSQMRMWGGKIDFEQPNTPRKDKKN